MAKKSANRKPVANNLKQDKATTSVPHKKTHTGGSSDWEQSYTMATHWQSDLKFFSDETQFLRILIDKYFMKLTDEENIAGTKTVALALSNLDKRRQELEQRLVEHSRHLANLMENPFPHNAQMYIDEHSDIERILSEFGKDFREIKKNIFLLTEQVIESEKAKHLLTR